VSTGLKKRKKDLGDNYHSQETKKKIGQTTVEHWARYGDDVRERLIAVLQKNAHNLRKFKPYDSEWQRKSRDLRKAGCARCGKQNRLVTHHIIPVAANGTNDDENLMPLCIGCHIKVEWAQKKIFEAVRDWEVVRQLIRQSIGGENGTEI